MQAGRMVGMAVPLLLSGTAVAGFVGVEVIAKPAGFIPGVGELVVCNVYAVFDNPDDELAAVAGTANVLMDISVNGGAWYQDPEGEPLTAPILQLLPGTSGALAYDTFVTIGTKVDNLSTTLDDVSTTPGLQFQDDCIGCGVPDSKAWFIIPSGPGNGGLGAPDADGRVLFFQGSFIKDGTATGITGENVILQFTADGVSGVQVIVSFNHLLECPWDCDGSADGNVNVADLLAVLAQFDVNAPLDCTGGSCDYNSDGCVDIVDLLKLLAHYNLDPVGGIGCPQ